MNEALTSALIGFGGSLVGAAAALLGTWLSNRHNAKEAKAQRAEETERLHEQDLKTAYVEWMHALQIRTLGLARLSVQMSENRKVDQAALYDEITRDVVFNAARLKITEKHPETYQLIDNTIRAYYEALSIVVKVQSSREQRTAATAKLQEVANKAHEGLRVRFTGQPLPNRITKSPSP